MTAKVETIENKLIAVKVNGTDYDKAKKIDKVYYVHDFAQA